MTGNKLTDEQLKNMMATPEEIHNVYDALEGAFIFMHTPEGSEYWYDLCKKLKSYEQQVRKYDKQRGED